MSVVSYYTGIKTFLFRTRHTSQRWLLLLFILFYFFPCRYKTHNICHSHFLSNSKTKRWLPADRWITLLHEKGKSSSGDSSWYSSWSDVCHKTSFACLGLIPSDGDNWPSSIATAFGSSSFHLSIERRLAFMKKLPTVVGSRPNCRAIVTCISFDGLFVSCKSVKVQLENNFKFYDIISI